MPAASMRSPLVANRTAFAMIRLGVSHIPMGLTPGHLSRAIRRQASRGEMPLGSTKVVQRRLAMAANAWHKSWEADLKEVQSLLHPCASMPEGPAALLRTGGTTTYCVIRTTTSYVLRTTTCCVLRTTTYHVLRTTTYWVLRTTTYYVLRTTTYCVLRTTT